MFTQTPVHKHFLRVSLALAALAFPVIVEAAPAAVSGIKATVGPDRKVHVTWTKPDGEIASYRLYYSHESILGNQGAYDDFESEAGTASEHIFAQLPPSMETLYVAMLAVDAQGGMSPYFAEEASLRLMPDTTQAAASSVPTLAPSSTPADEPVNINAPTLASSEASSAPTQAGASSLNMNAPLRLLSAQATTATGITLTFSGNVSVDPSGAWRAIKIVDASGGILPITKLIIQGPKISLNTLPQERNRVYRVTVDPDVVTTRDPSGHVQQMDPSQNPLLFLGSIQGVPYGTTNYGNGTTASQPTSQPPQQQPQQPAQNGALQDISNLQLRGEHVGAMYAVTATWQPPSGTIAEYRVSQTRDGGMTYSQPQSVPGNAASLKIQNVPGGSFGVAIQVVANGTVSRGVLQLITLPLTTAATKPATTTTVKMPTTTTTASVTNPLDGKGKGDEGKGKGKGTLPSSGMADVLPILVAGGSTGWTLVRRRKQKVVA